MLGSGNSCTRTQTRADAMSRRIIAGGARWPTCRHLDSGDCAGHAAVGIRYSRNGIRENGPSQWTMEQGQLAWYVHLLPPMQSAERMWSSNNNGCGGGLGEDARRSYFVTSHVTQPSELSRSELELGAVWRIEEVLRRNCSIRQSIANPVSSAVPISADLSPCIELR